MTPVHILKSVSCNYVTNELNKIWKHVNQTDLMTQLSGCCQQIKKVVFSIQTSSLCLERLRSRSRSSVQISFDKWQTLKSQLYILLLVSFWLRAKFIGLSLAASLGIVELSSLKPKFCWKGIIQRFCDTFLRSQLNWYQYYCRFSYLSSSYHTCFHPLNPRITIIPHV